MGHADRSGGLATRVPARRCALALEARSRPRAVRARLLVAAPAARRRSRSPPRSRRAMRSAGSSSGAFVVNATTGKTVFRLRQSTPRILASNTKLFTTTAALARFGTEGTLGTEVRGRGALAEDGIWRGNLYLRGGGDPTFGSRLVHAPRLRRRRDRRGAREAARRGGHRARHRSRRRRRVALRLAARRPGLRLRHLDLGRPAERAVVQPRPRQRGRQRLPDQAAAVRRRPPRRGAGGARDRGQAAPRAAASTPGDADVLASVDSPPMARLVALTNKPSDNFFAEMLAQGPRAAGQRPRHHHRRRAPGRRLRRAGSARAPRSPTARASRAATAPRRKAVVDAAARDARARRVRRASTPRCRSPAATARSPRACAAARRAATAAARPARSRTSARCRATARPARATSTSSRS